MNKEQILKAIQNLQNKDGMIITENGDNSILNNGKDKWRMKSNFGWLEYTTEELAEELSDWDEEIFLIS